MGSYLSAADVVVLPYTKTYQSGVLLAAYAAGRPVVVTDTGGLSEVVEHGKTGLVVPPRDPESLADAISRLLEDPSAAAGDGPPRTRAFPNDVLLGSHRRRNDAPLSVARGWSVLRRARGAPEALRVGESRAPAARRGGNV